MNYRNLESERLIYRRFTADDYDDLYEIMSNENVRRYLPGDGALSKEKSQDCLSSFMKSFSLEKPNLIYAILLKGSAKVIGYCGFAYIKEYNKNEIMYGLNEDYWYKGYASEAAFKMKELASELNQDIIIAFTHVNNQTSEKIILKIGYTYIETIELWGLTLKYYELKLKGE